MPGYTKQAAALTFPKGQEQAVVLFLNRGGSVKTVQRVAVGARGMVDVQINGILSAARANRAASFVLVHNHPSGTLRPSMADVAATVAITEAGRRAGIPLRDHLVYANGEVKSILTAKRGTDCPDCAFTLRDFPGEAGKATLKRAHARAREIRRSGEKYPDALKRAWADLKGQGAAEFPGPHGTAHGQDAHAIARNIRQPGEKYSDALKRGWASLKGVATDSTSRSPKSATESRRPAARQKTTSRKKTAKRPTESKRRFPPPVAEGSIPPEKIRAAVKNAADASAEITTTATGPDPTVEYRFAIRVVDLFSLIPSHTDAMAPNPDYPAELQPRIRDRASSRQQIAQIAANLKPEAILVDSGTLDRGMPIVGPDLVVESGNGRVLALRKAKTDHPDNYKAYVGILRLAVKEKYPELLAAASEIESPALVRVRLTEVDRVAFAASSNEATTLSMSPLEQALQDAGRITDEALATLEVSESQSVDQALLSATNRPLVSHFVGALAANERAALVGAAGELNTLGLQRLKGALFAKVYPGEAGHRLTKAFVESLDPVLKNVESAMFESLPAMAKAEGLIRSGARAADLSLADDLAKSVDMLARLKSTNQVAEDFIRQASAFGRELTPEQERLLVFLEAQGRSRKVLREFMQEYAAAVNAASHPDQGAMFAGATETKPELLDRLITAQTKKASTGALFQLIEARQTAGLADPLKQTGHWAGVQLRDSDVVFAVKTKRPNLFAAALTDNGHRASVGAVAGVVVTSASKKQISSVARAIKAQIEFEEPTGPDLAAGGFQAELEPGMFPRSTEPDAPPDPEQAALFDSGAPETLATRGVGKLGRYRSIATSKVLKLQTGLLLLGTKAKLEESNLGRLLDTLDQLQAALAATPLLDPDTLISRDPEIGPPGVSREDIPYEVGVRAHNGTSWVPEQRAKQEQFAWVQWMNKVWSDMNKRATNDEERARVPGVFEEYRAWALPAQIALLGRRGGMISAMIAGPSNFNFRRAGKQGDAYQKAFGEHIKQEEKRLKRALETIRPRTNGPISSGDPEAVQKLQAKIDKAKAVQESMKTANKIIRKHGLLDSEKIRQLEALEGISPRVASNLVAGDFLQRKGFPAYEITGNLANIKRMEGRIASIERERAIPEMDVTFDGGTISEDKSANRLRIFFDSKPEPEIRTKLKRAGFRWSPSVGAWQRQLNQNARLAAHQVIVDRRIAGEGERAPAAETPAQAPEPEIPAHPDPVGTDEAVEAENPTSRPITGQPTQLQLLDPKKRRRGAKKEKEDSGEGGAFRHLLLAAD